MIERATDPRFQDYLKLVPQYQKLLNGKQFVELTSVVKVIAAQLDTTWDKGLADLTGGGILAAFEADAGKEPRFYLIITAKDADLLERANQTLLKLVRQDAKDKRKPDPVKTSEHRGRHDSRRRGPATRGLRDRGRQARRLQLGQESGNADRPRSRGSSDWRSQHRRPETGGLVTGRSDGMESAQGKARAGCVCLGTRPSRPVAEARPQSIHIPRKSPTPA